MEASSVLGFVVSGRSGSAVNRSLFFLCLMAAGLGLFVVLIYVVMFVTLAWVGLLLFGIHLLRRRDTGLQLTGAVLVLLALSPFIISAGSKSSRGTNQHRIQEQVPVNTRDIWNGVLENLVSGANQANAVMFGPGKPCYPFPCNGTTKKETGPRVLGQPRNGASIEEPELELVEQPESGSRGEGAACAPRVSDQRNVVCANTKDSTRTVNGVSWNSFDRGFADSFGYRATASVPDGKWHRFGEPERIK
jgi:hypothetical protein